MIRILAGTSIALALLAGCQTVRLNISDAKNDALTQKVATAQREGAQWKKSAETYAKALTDLKAKVENATKLEDQRREAALRDAKATSQRAIAELQRTRAQLAALKEESRRASLALDSVLCLPADSVRRIAAFR